MIFLAVGLQQAATNHPLTSKIIVSATILPHMSEKYQEIKLWQGFKIFKNL